VRRYKAECVTRYDAIVTTAAAADELRAGFGAAMAGTLRDEAALHRLWYDLRNQSQFEEKLRADAAEIDRSLERMIWRIVGKYAELSGRDLAVTPALAYALLDGVFQHALLRHLSGDATAAEDLDKHVQQVLPAILA
jgi:muconolactone delta-isomerase